VKLAAAARSGSVTTAITYDDGVGTSLCERSARAERRVSATESDGDMAARMSALLEGMWVKTIVFNSPIRRESQTATLPNF